MLPSTKTEFAGSLNAAQLKHLPQADIELLAQTTRNRILFDSIAAFARIAGRGLAIAARPLAGWWSRTQVQDELMGMDDRMLADIGISRADIPAVAAGRYQGHTIRAPRLVAEQVNHLWHQDIPVADNEQAAHRVA
jgi:uncharacterized protein YjiS (DUF1127 family)